MFICLSASLLQTQALAQFHPWQVAIQTHDDRNLLETKRQDFQELWRQTHIEIYEALTENNDICWTHTLRHHPPFSGSPPLGMSLV